MGQEVATEAGTLSDASHTVQRARMEADTDQARLLRPDRHTAWRTDGGDTGAVATVAEPHRHLFAQLGQIRMGGQRN